MEKTLYDKEIFENYPVPKAVMTMAIPTILGQLIVLIYNMADTFFLGKTNNPDMIAAASLILPIYNLCLSFAGLAGLGGGSLVSRLLGRNEIDEAKKVGSFSIYFCIITGAFFSFLVLFSINPLLNLLGADQNTYDFARDYALCVIVVGGIPTVLSNTLAALLRSLGESKKAAFGITLGGIINIILDPLFMFALLQKGNEIIGAGAATCLSNVISCAFFIFVIRRNKEKLSIIQLGKIKDLPKSENIKNIFYVGIPSSITTLLFDLDYIVIDKLMSFYGNTALAAIGIVLKIERLPLNVGVGICQGMIPIVAYSFSQKNFERMKKIRNFSLLFGIIFALCSLVIYESFSKNIIELFIKEEEETIILGTSFLKARSFATPFMFLCFFHTYLFTAVGKGNLSLILGTTRWALVNIPMLFILNMLLGINGIVFSQLVSDAFVAIISFMLYFIFERNNIKNT